MQFLKGSQQVINQGDEIPSWDEQADKVRRQMSELFDAQNLSFLFGSGSSSMWKDDEEHGIPTMGPLAGEFKSWFEGTPNPNATVTRPQKDRLLAQVGIDLSAGEYNNNLERLMDVLLNAERFCTGSTKPELNGSVPLIQEVIDGDIEKMMEDLFGAVLIGADGKEIPTARLQRGKVECFHLVGEDHKNETWEEVIRQTERFVEFPPLKLLRAKLAERYDRH